MASSDWVEKEHALLRALHRWDRSWADRDIREMEKVLKSDATLHADALLFEYDVHGAEAILDVHRRYFYKYEFKHHQITSAANPDKNSAFGFWQDIDIHRHAEPKVPGSAAAAETAPVKGQGSEESGVTIAGIWKLVFDKDIERVTDIYFLRQLHPEEAAHRLNDPSTVAIGGAHEHRYKSLSEKKDAKPEVLQGARKAAGGFSRMWQSGDTSCANELLDENMRAVDLMHGGEKVGREDYCTGIREVMEHFKFEDGEFDVGVSPDGHSAIVHWTYTGRGESGNSFRMYGLNLLIIDPKSGKITESAGFRQISAGERSKLLRPDAFLHSEVPHK